MAAIDVLNLLRAFGQDPNLETHRVSPRSTVGGQPYGQLLSEATGNMRSQGYGVDEFTKYLQDVLGQDADNQRRQLMLEMARGLSKSEGLDGDLDPDRRAAGSIGRGNAILAGRKLREMGVDVQPLLSQFTMPQRDSEILAKEFGDAGGGDKDFAAAVEAALTSPAPEKKTEEGGNLFENIAAQAAAVAPKDDEQMADMDYGAAFSTSEKPLPEVDKTAKKAVKEEAAPKAEVVADEDTIRKLFRVAHGTDFDPNSSMDKRKRTEIEDLLAQQGGLGSMTPNQFALKLYRANNYV